MNSFKKEVTIHFVLDNKLYAQRAAFHVPRAKDEIRLADNKIYTVKKVVWVYDEEEHPRSRVNVEIEKMETNSETTIAELMEKFPNGFSVGPGSLENPGVVSKIIYATSHLRRVVTDYSILDGNKGYLVVDMDC